MRMHELHSDLLGYEVIEGVEVRISEIQTLIGKRIIEAAYPDDDELYLRFDDDSTVRISAHGGIGADYLVVLFEES